MKKFVLVENQLTKLTPFKHYHDLINLKINSNNQGGLSFDSISDFDQMIKLFRHNEYNAPYYLNITDTDCTIHSWDEKQTANIPIFELLEKCHDKNTNRHWIACCWTESNKSNGLKDLVYVYRNEQDDTIRDVFSDNIVNNGFSIISNTVFIIHGEWIDVPLYHVLINDNLLYWPVQTVDTDAIFVDTVSYHDGRFAEYVFKPRMVGCFEHDNIVITPRDKFTIDFYGRSRFYLRNNDFPFDKLKLKIKSNIKYTQASTGVYEFDLQGKDVGYLYARINAGYGAEIEASTRMRLAYTVHRS